MDLNLTWYVLVVVLVAGYAILDGFDLGVGMLHPFIPGDDERRLAINAIGPVWDGNEVWLVTAGGALFAAFPEVYATAFSGFYLPFMLLLVALIFRAVAIEFRSKQPMRWWRRAWDAGFALGSLLIAVLTGLALGNIILGLPLAADHELRIPWWRLLTPYPLLVAATTVALFAMHGAIYLALKTEGPLHERVRRWVRPTMIAFIMLYVVLTMATLAVVPHMTGRLRAEPWLSAIPAATVLAVANIPRLIHHGRDFHAFLSSGLTIALLFALVAIGLFPDLLRSTPFPERSLTAYNAASSAKTLGIMLVVAALGVPVVLAYTTCIYWVFRGKVRLDPHSY